MKLSRRIFSFLLVMALLVSALPVTVFAKGPVMYGIGFTTGSDLRLRSEASTSSKTICYAPKGEVVIVIGKSGDWYHVQYNLQEGYMHSNYVDVKTSRNAELGYGKVNSNEVNMRTGPGTNYRSVNIGNKGDIVYTIGLNSGWYKVIFKNDICYIRSDFVDLTEIPYENAASSNTPLFFENGVSTGVTPSAGALQGSSNSDTPVQEPEENEPVPTEPKETQPKEEEKTEETKSDGLVDGIAFVNASSLYLRKEASTGAKSLGAASRGEVVVVLDKVGDWYKVNYNLKEGYMHGKYLSVSNPGNAELGYGKITGNGVNLRSGPSTSHSAVSTGYKGSKAYILGVENGWYRVIFGNNICYIRSDYLSLTQIPYENKASSKAPLFYKDGKSTGTEPSASALNGNSGSNNNSSSATGVTGAQIVATAQKYLGTPYVWGGTSPAGFDCSGFVYYVLRSVGLKPGRMQVDQYKMGVYVEKSELQPGDIVFFQNTYKSGLSHVGIYVGDGQFIHAPNSRGVVSYADLYSTYYTNHYYGARRVVSE